MSFHPAVSVFFSSCSFCIFFPPAIYKIFYLPQHIVSCWSKSKLFPPKVFVLFFILQCLNFLLLQYIKYFTTFEVIYSESKSKLIPPAGFIVFSSCRIHCLFILQFCIFFLLQYIPGGSNNTLCALKFIGQQFSVAQCIEQLEAWYGSSGFLVIFSQAYVAVFQLSLTEYCYYCVI